MKTKDSNGPAIVSHLRSWGGAYFICIIVLVMFGIGIQYTINLRKEIESDPHYGKWHIPKGAILDYDSASQIVSVPVDTTGDRIPDTHFLIGKYLSSQNYYYKEALGSTFKEEVILLGAKKHVFDCSYMECFWADSKKLFAAIPIQHQMAYY